MTERDVELLTLPRGPGRQLRVRLCEWQGRARVDIREWFENDGNWIPGKGASVRANEIAAVASAFACAAGLIDRQGRIETKPPAEPTEGP